MALFQLWYFLLTRRLMVTAIYSFRKSTGALSHGITRSAHYRHTIQIACCVLERFDLAVQTMKNRTFMKVLLEQYIMLNKFLVKAALCLNIFFISSFSLNYSQSFAQLLNISKKKKQIKVSF
jgi:hypothetical protein